MDKLVPVIEFFKKYGFWILCSIIALSSIGVWFMASGAIDKKNRDLTSKIEQSFKTGKNLQGTYGEEDIRKHPNTTSEEGMKQEIDRVAESLVKAWGKRYESQAKFKIWPEEVKSQNAEFVSTFEKFKLPETFPEDFEANNIITLLEIYKKHIPKVMTRISKIIGTQWEYAPEDDEAEEGDESDESDEGGRGGGQPPGGVAPGAGGRGDGGRGDGGRGKKKPKSTIDNRVVCEWNDANQLVWDSKLTSFENRDDNALGDNIPTPSQIYMLQQDLWLLESVFTVIRKVNSREKDGVSMVKANDLATVKRIDHIAFGREALAKVGDITPIADETENERGSGIGRDGPPRGGRPRGKKGANSGYGEIEYNQQPAFHARYVDKEMTKVYTAEEIRKALSPGTTLPTGENLGLLVARRVPVRLAVKIDETKIPEFVAACADSPFPFKVNQVRVNKHEANGGIVHAGGGGRASGAKKKKKSRELAAAGQSNLGNEGGASSAIEGGSVETRTNYDVKAEFFGYITVYNPVDEARLTGKKPEADADAEEDTTNPKP